MYFSTLKKTLCVSLLAIASQGHSATPETMNFIVMGDTGTGADAQYQVAHAIEKICTEKTCNFAIGMGDNIYEYGANSATDPQFQDKFEKPYANLNFPFFMALGNHDQSIIFPGDGTAYWKGSDEVNYSAHSSKWKMPTRYYSVNAKNSAADALLIAYDSNPMKTYLPQLNPYWWPKGTYMQDQAQWIKTTLAASTATWKFAFAHHQYKSNGSEVITPFWWSSQASFAESALCGKVDFILAGHVHAMEVLDQKENCGGGVTNMINSGAAAKTQTDHNNDYSLVFDTYKNGDLGFMLFTINGKRLDVTAYTVKGDQTTVAFTKTYTK
jgi:tartrate-resistant acid phosphatase type 5